MRVRRISSVWFELSLSIACICMTNAQLLCPPITISDLGSTTSFSIDGLVPTAIVPPGEATPNIPVRIIDFSMVCEASGNRRNTASYVSVVVQFQCNFQSSDLTLANCDGSTVITRQFQFECDSANTWAGSGLFVQTLMPTATLMTPLDNRCRRCIDDEGEPEAVVNATTHCQACSMSCNQGQMRCHIGNPFDVCCNFYEDNQCRAACSPALESDDNFDCVCPNLTLANGSVTFEPQNRVINSVATHSCDSGHRLVGGATRSCANTGWSGENVTCEFIQCPDPPLMNGVVTVSPPGRGVGSKTMYECNLGFTLNGDGNRICQESGQWNGTDPVCANCSIALVDPNCIECGFDSRGNPVCVQCKDPTFKIQDGKCETNANPGAQSGSCDTPCVIGIVLAILGAIILSVVVVLVVYAVYRYLSNPATKLAKAGTEGLNGVARDNPLYLPPEEIVGDVGDVETA